MGGVWREEGLGLRGSGGVLWASTAEARIGVLGADVTAGRTASSRDVDGTGDMSNLGRLLPPLANPLDTPLRVPLT